MERKRLDALLVDRGLLASRERAKGHILAGEVYVDGCRETKPGTNVPVSAAIELRGCRLPYVSRGGLKLEKALQTFAVKVAGRQALDVGASTGGFTDCLLQHGASHVWAVDVGYGQLAWELRQDERVTVLERTNIRYLLPGQVPRVSLVVIDVSFISLAKVLPSVVPFVLPEGDIVALVKPQFEAGREDVGKKGVVKDPDTHVRVLQMVCEKATSLGLEVRSLDYSPIRGPQGNIEFLLHLRAAVTPSERDWNRLIVDVVSAAHDDL